MTGNQAVAHCSLFFINRTLQKHSTALYRTILSSVSPNICLITYLPKGRNYHADLERWPLCMSTVSCRCYGLVTLHFHEFEQHIDPCKIVQEGSHTANRRVTFNCTCSVLLTMFRSFSKSFLHLKIIVWKILGEFLTTQVANILISMEWVKIAFQAGWGGWQL